MKVDPISSTWPPLPPPPDHHRVILCHSSSFNGGLQWWMTCSAVLRRDDSPQDQVVVTASILLQQSKASLVFDPDLTKELDFPLSASSWTAEEMKGPKKDTRDDSSSGCPKTMGR